MNSRNQVNLIGKVDEIIQDIKNTHGEKRILTRFSLKRVAQTQYNDIDEDKIWVLFPREQGEKFSEQFKGNMKNKEISVSGEVRSGGTLKGVSYPLVIILVSSFDFID